eukprot:scaffold70573_cov20-Tisochrysis_lutea.AAC.1
MSLSGVRRSPCCLTCSWGNWQGTYMLSELVVGHLYYQVGLLYYQDKWWRFSLAVASVFAILGGLGAGPPIWVRGVSLNDQGKQGMTRVRPGYEQSMSR